ncbi:MAG: universal stress protein [Chloroflexi bacterium]|nr:universal stress protein [Chloroflexota bacterium]
MKILLAYDGGEPARKALDLTADFAKKFDASVAVVSVVPVHPGRVPIDPWDDTPVHASQLAEAKRLLLDKGIEAALIERAGDPAHTIEQIAQDGGYDMVVVGSRHLGAVSRVLQGSVSEHIATHSPATVVIAR